MKAPDSVLLHLENPVHGCILVFSRLPNPAHGHVGFWDSSGAEDDDWYYNVLSGNQNNRVMVKPYQKSRFIGAYWPATHPLPHEAVLVDAH
jgi:hypothetical protein